MLPTWPSYVLEGVFEDHEFDSYYIEMHYSVDNNRLLVYHSPVFPSSHPASIPFLRGFYVADG